jgi:trk system potassium uptake protein TrkA
LEKRQIAVIGLGRFGSSLLRELTELGHEVLGIDTNMGAVEDAAEYATHAVQADATDEDSLRQLGIDEFGAAVVGIGTDLKSSILITLALKRLRVPMVVCKAQDDRHGEILTKLGADRVVFPEKETAVRLAHALTSGLTETDYMEVSPRYGIAKMIVPPLATGRRLEELDLRGRFGVTVLAIRSGERVILNPSRYETVKGGDTMIVAGEDAKLENVRVE